MLSPGVARMEGCRASNEGYLKVPEDFTFTEKVGKLKVPNSAFTFKTLCSTDIDPTVSRHDAIIIRDWHGLCCLSLMTLLILIVS